MPKIDVWTKFPKALQQHLIDRMRDRSITIADLNKLRLWVDSRPEVPDADWYKDFGSFKLCGQGRLPKTFLLKDQTARGPNYNAACFKFFEVGSCGRFATSVPSSTGCPQKPRSFFAAIALSACPVHRYCAWLRTFYTASFLARAESSHPLSSTVRSSTRARTSPSPDPE